MTKNYDCHSRGRVQISLRFRETCRWVKNRAKIVQCELGISGPQRTVQNKKLSQKFNYMAIVLTNQTPLSALALKNNDLRKSVWTIHLTGTLFCKSWVRAQMIQHIYWLHQNNVATLIRPTDIFRYCNCSKYQRIRTVLSFCWCLVVMRLKITPFTCWGFADEAQSLSAVG